MTARGTARRVGVGMYVGAFALLLVAAYVLLRANVESSLTFVWLSMGLAGLSALVAVASVVIPEPSRPRAGSEADRRPVSTAPTATASDEG